MSFTQADLIAMQARLNRGKMPPPDDAVSHESDLHNQIINHCKNVGWIYFHGSMAHRSMRVIGEPDFTILANKGRVFFIECKTKIGKLSTEQLGIKLWAEKLGHVIHTVRSFQEFVDVIAPPNP